MYHTFRGKKKSNLTQPSLGSREQASSNESRTETEIRVLLAEFTTLPLRIASLRAINFYLDGGGDVLLGRTGAAVEHKDARPVVCVRSELLLHELLLVGRNRSFVRTTKNTRI